MRLMVTISTYLDCTVRRIASQGRARARPCAQAPVSEGDSADPGQGAPTPVRQTPDQVAMACRGKTDKTSKGNDACVIHALRRCLRPGCLTGSGLPVRICP